MRRLWQKLKSHFYKARAQKMNQAAENRKIEEEFRLLQESKMVKNSDKLVCPPEKLRKHFTKHFSPRYVPTPPEVYDPQSYPHILPDDKIVVDETPPTVEEVKSAILKLKNGKATGTDGLAAELLKYNDCVALHEIDQLDIDCGIEIEYCINMRSTDRTQRAIDTPSGNLKIKIILYADDKVLFCRSASSFQLSVDVMNSVFTRFGLKIAEDDSNDDFQC